MSGTLRTWGGRSSFEYSGSVFTGTEIRYGKGSTISVTRDQYAGLLRHFGSRTVSIGTSRTNPPPGSVGEWLQKHVTRTAIASYVGPILVHEGYAVRGQKRDRIRFVNRLVDHAPPPEKRGEPDEADYLQGIRQRVAKLEKLDPTMREEMERGLREVERAPCHAALAICHCLMAVVRSLEEQRSTTERDLYSRIQNLENVPRIVINHMHTVRTIRNIAEHSEEPLPSADVYPSIEAMVRILEWWEATS